MTEIYFQDKKSAFAWYVEEGGQHKKTYFYEHIPADGKKVERFHVSEMLRKERKESPRVAGLSDQREEAETRKAVADANKAEVQAAQLLRELDKEWIKRADAEADTCIAAALVRDGIVNRLIKAIPGLIHAAGGSPDRVADVQAVIDTAVADGCNDVANCDEREVEII